MTKKMDKKQASGRVFIVIGLLLLAAALSYTGYNLWLDWRAGVASEQALSELADIVPTPPPPAPSPSASAPPGEPEVTPTPVPTPPPPDPDQPMLTVTVDGQEYIGTLSIPALELELPIISEWSDARLKLAPCRYVGTAYKSGFVIAGHNYKRHFAPIRTLTGGEAVSFTDAEGRTFSYTVTRTEVLKPTAIEEMTSSEWDLTLFTCTPGGKARFALRCTAVSEPATEL